MEYVSLVCGCQNSTAPRGEVAVVASAFDGEMGASRLIVWSLEREIGEAERRWSW